LFETLFGSVEERKVTTNEGPDTEMTVTDGLNTPTATVTPY
jgi:hypothetical protein